MMHAEILPRNALPVAVDSSLLGEQTRSSLFANFVRVYRQHFRVIFGCCLLPMFPFVLLNEVVKATAPKWAPLALLPYLVAAFVLPAALTVALSDICLGNKPTVRRSYARILRGNRWWHLISTTLLFVLAMEFGLLLFVLPGLWLMTRGLFISIIVALEGRRNIDAIRRSIALTKGQVWRIAGLLLPASVPVLVLSVVMVTPKPAMMAFVVNILGNLLVLAVFTPALGLALVLLYYDQRVRRESYDAQALSEDLMR